MMFPQVVLILSGLGFVGFGVAFLIAPVAMAAIAGIELPHASAVTDVRAIYGGLELALGAFQLYCATRPELRSAGLVSVALAFGGILFGRLSGMAIDGARDGATLAAAAIEIAGTVLGIAAVVRDRSARGAS